MTATCVVCTRPTDAYLCRRPCADELETALGDLPALVDALATAAVRQTRVYRATGRRAAPDEELADLEEEYGWRRTRIPSHLRTRDARVTLPGTAATVDFDAADLLDHTGNLLATWARHLAETRRAPLNLSTGHATEGPVCPPHIHHATVIGCHDLPAGCRNLHPHHAHTTSRPPCPDDCRRLHCDHASCARIRHGEYTGTAAALVRWFLRHTDTIRYDEAAGDMHRQIVGLRDAIMRAVDRAPSPFYAGPCHAMIDVVEVEERDGTTYTTRRQARCERDLYRWPTKSEIVCDGYRGDQRGCGTVHALAGREYWLLASAEDALLPLTAWQEALPGMLPQLAWPNRSTWWRWQQAGRLFARSVDRAAVELFRGGDVIDLVRSEQARIVGNIGRAKRGRMSA